MSKARSMYAGSSGSNYGVNKNSPGNGNGKWQGLWPSVGHARNARLINTRAGGNNRNVVFCMNQLGGVGRISNMFATTADGVTDCKNGKLNWTGPFLPKTLHELLKSLDKDNNNFITTSEAEQSGYGFLKDFDNDGYLGIEDYRRNYDLLENNYNLGSSSPETGSGIGRCSDPFIDCGNGPLNESILHYFNIYTMDMTGDFDSNSAPLFGEGGAGASIYGWLKNDRVGSSNHITCNQNAIHTNHYNAIVSAIIGSSLNEPEELRSSSCQGELYRSNYVPDNYGCHQFSDCGIAPSIKNLSTDLNVNCNYCIDIDKFKRSVKNVNVEGADDEYITRDNLQFRSIDQPVGYIETDWRILGLFTVINSDGKDGFYLRLGLRPLAGYENQNYIRNDHMKKIFRPGKNRLPKGKYKHLGYKLVVKTGTKENPNIPTFLIANLDTNDAKFVGLLQPDGTVLLKWALNPKWRQDIEHNVEDGPLELRPNRIFSVYFDRLPCPAGQQRSDINEKCKQVITPYSN